MGRFVGVSLALAIAMTGGPPAAAQQDIEALKAQAIAYVDGKAKLNQEIIDTLFSFAEPAFEEEETGRYLTKILKDEGFTIQLGVGGMPTAWVATWTNGTGGPGLSFISDVDGLRGVSQKPGVLANEPLVEGGDGHGEGHNTGMAVSILGALATKKIMQEQGIAGTLQIWPGIAEEVLGAKAFYVRAGVFKGIDVVLANHVGRDLMSVWGQEGSLGLISMEYRFKGTTAHAAGDPWDGRSALDAVELMNAGWNYRREHLRPEQRSHYVITQGGDQPNVVPGEATVWYYFRNVDAKSVDEMRQIADRIATGASQMTDTSWSRRILGSAWPRHNNKVIGEVYDANIVRVGMPQWSADDQAYAKAVQTALGAPVLGLKTEVTEMAKPGRPGGSGSDDIGTVMWTLPTARLYYPANIQGLKGHSWEAALASATPIAHKGALAGAKVTALTAIDFLLKPDLIAQAKAYFTDVQTKDIKYYPLEDPTDVPAIWVNAEADTRNRPQQRKFYYDAKKYRTYLDQLGVKYPVLTK